MRIFGLLQCKSPPPNELVEEIDFLFKSDSDSIKKLTRVVRVSITPVHRLLVMIDFLCYIWLQEFVQDNASSDSDCQGIVPGLPVSIVGRFVSRIVRNASGKGPTSLLTLLPAAPQLSPLWTIIPVYMGSKLTLHSVHNFTPMQMFQLIFTVFDSVPNSFQLLQCSPNTSRQQLDLFFDRIIQWKQFHYLVMGVNYLPNELQEVNIEKNFIICCQTSCYCFNVNKIADACTEVLPSDER